MLFGYFLAYRQSDPRARIFRSAVQTLKDEEDPIEKLRGDSDSVVGDGKNPFLFRSFGRDVNVRDFFPAKFYRVADEILKNLRHFEFIG